MKKKWFTIPELFIVISIVAILSIIAFISLSTYNGNARDTKRLEQVWNITNALTLFSINTAKFPETSSGIVVTYSGSEVWTQGNFWAQTIRVTWKLFWDYKDPKFWNFYSYSVTSNRKEYQLWIMLEGDNVVAYNPIYESAFAASITTKLFWNYNWLIVHSKTGSTSNVLFAPSITAIDLSNTDWLYIISQKKLAYSSFSASPYSYKNTSWYQWTWTNLNAWTPLLYSWSTQNLGTYTNIKNIDTALRTYINWSTIKVRNTDFLSSTWTTYVKNILSNFIGVNPISPYYCKEILDSWASTWSGFYMVDSDGVWWSSSYEVYCDMSTSSWGRTRIGDNNLTRWDFQNWFNVENWTEVTYNRENTIVSIPSPNTTWYALNQHSVSWYNTWNNYGDIRYLLTPNDISSFKNGYEIRLSAWVADAWDQWTNTNGWLWYVFSNTLNYSDGSSVSNGLMETLGTQTVNWKVWKLQRVRIPVTKTVTSFEWDVWQWTETWLSKNFYVTDLKIEIYYR